MRASRRGVLGAAIALAVLAPAAEAAKTVTTAYRPECRVLSLGGGCPTWNPLGGLAIAEAPLVGTAVQSPVVGSAEQTLVIVPAGATLIGSTTGRADGGGDPLAAQIRLPGGLDARPGGSVVVADPQNNVVWGLEGGAFRRLAGLADGTGGYSDGFGCVIFLPSPIGGGRCLRFGFLADAAQLNAPADVAFTSDGLLVADTGNSVVRSVRGGQISVFAGTASAPGDAGDGGAAAGARLDRPQGVLSAPDGTVFIADTGNARIRVVRDGGISTYAGTGAAGFDADTGPATARRLNQPTKLALDQAGNLYIADTGNNRIRRVMRATGEMETIAGSGGAVYQGDGREPLRAAIRPVDVAVDANGTVLVLDSPPPGGASSPRPGLRVIANTPPVPSFTVSAPGPDPLVRRLDASSSADDGRIDSHRWSIGGGEPSGSVVDHRFPAPGAYPVRLNVTDDNGVAASVEQTVQVEPPAPPPAGGTTTGGNGTKDPPVTAQALSGLSGTARGTFRLSRLRGGAVTLTGSAPRAARLLVTVRSGARVLARATSETPAGPFTRTLPLPASTPPGILRITVTELAVPAGGAALPAGAASARIAAPPEGVAVRAWISTAAGGAVRARIPRRPRFLVANFRMAALPARGRRLSVVWRLGGAAFAIPALRPEGRLLTGQLGSVGGGRVAAGRWTATLLAGRTPVAVARVTVG